MKSILDPTFKYTNAACTNLHEKFKLIRRELAKQSQLPPKVAPIKKLRSA